MVRAAVATGLLVLVPSAFTAVLTNDGLESSTHPTGDRTSATAPGIPFYTRFATGGSASIVSDATLGSKALSIADTESSTSTSFPVVGVLPSAANLDINDILSVSFRFRYVNSGASTASNNGFRFGLADSNLTAVTADGQANSDNDPGYYVALGFGGTLPATNAIFYNETGGIGNILSGTDRAAATASSNTGTNINNNSVHTATFSLTRNASTITLSLVLDGAAPITATSTSNLRTRFDEIAFGGGFSVTGQAYMVDDIVVTHVPEPATMGLAALAAPLLLRRRRS